MELIELAYYAQVLAFVGLFSYLGIAYNQVRLERKVHTLMTTEVGTDDENAGDQKPVFSHKVAGQDHFGGITEWESLSWESKMQYMNMQHKLNWASAIVGVLTVLSGMIWGWGELSPKWDGGLGREWLYILTIAFLAGLGYVFWSYYQRWRIRRGDYSDMKQNNNQRN